jgi:hypothetical protein
MMCVCVTVTAESQEIQASAEEFEGTTEIQSEITTNPGDEPENHNVPTGGYHSNFPKVSGD